MDWTCCEFRHLNSYELYAILRARNAILVVEDAHTYLDIDGKDEFAIHVFALDEQVDTPSIAAYARLLPGDDTDPETAVDKLLTSDAHRDDDTIVELVEQVLAAAQARWPDAPVRLHAPAHHKAFYNRFGFRKADGPFLDNGVPYIGMIRPVGGVSRPAHGRRTLANVEPRHDGERYTFASRLPADSGANR